MAARRLLMNNVALAMRSNLKHSGVSMMATAATTTAQRSFSTASKGLLSTSLLLASSSSSSFKFVGSTGISNLILNSSSKRSFATLSSGDVKDILQQADYQKLRKQLESEGRESISINEFQSLATSLGLKDLDAPKIAQAFSNAGVVLYLPNASDPAIRNVIHLKPQKVTQALLRAIDVDGSEIQRSIQHLEKLKQEYAELTVIKERIDQKAHNYANTIIYLTGAYLFIQCGILARLTWWEFSWDIVEPITYFVTFTGALISYVYFATTRSEYTYENMRDRFAHSKRDKLYKRDNFDIQRYEQLHKTIVEQEHELRHYLPSAEAAPKKA